MNYVLCFFFPSLPDLIGVTPANVLFKFWTLVTSAFYEPSILTLIPSIVSTPASSQ